MHIEQITNPKVAHHRNGVGGRGFYVVLFDWRDYDAGKTRKMVATVFDGDEEGLCSVFDVDELAKGNIEFARGNSWRGDQFERLLRVVINNVAGYDRVSV